MEWVSVEYNGRVWEREESGKEKRVGKRREQEREERREWGGELAQSKVGKEGERKEKNFADCDCISITSLDLVSSALLFPLPFIFIMRTTDKLLRHRHDASYRFCPDNALNSR